MIELASREPVDACVRGSAQEWVRSATARLMPTHACAAAEHLFGVLPLIGRFFDRPEAQLAAVRAGAALGALGLFAPAPDRAWGDAALAGERTGRDVQVHGEVRVASHAAAGSIVLVRLSDDERLAWLDHAAPGVEPRACTAAPLPNHAPRWLVVNGALIPDPRVSRPVSLAPGSEVYECLEHYVAVWALVALDVARRTVRALRRAARSTRAYGRPEPFGASQIVSMDLTELEVEIDMTAAAAASYYALAAPPHPSGLVLALAAARALAACAAKADEFRNDLDIRADGPLSENGTASTIAAHVGGVLMLTNELARAMLGPVAR